MELRPLAKEILRKTGYDVIQHDERGSPVARRLMSFKSVFGDADTGQLMQVDGLFFRDRS